MSGDILLRVLTGRMVGHYMMRELNRVAFIALDNLFCVSLTSAAAASFIDRTGGMVRLYTYRGDNASAILDRVEEENIQALLLAFGGEGESVIIGRLTDFLREISLRNMEVDIILHVRAYAVGGLREALNDRDVRFYLQGSNNLYVYTSDMDNGYLILNIAEIHDDHVHLHEIEKFPLTLEHTALLNRSFRNKTLLWKDGV